MSSGRRAVRPVRQLSLQQPTPRRQHIRRQRSAEDDKSLQIYANPIARGRLTGNAAEKPKVRVAWSDDRRGCDGDLERVEVVARQIPGRSRQTTSGRSGVRGYVGAEKASILYSRQELAERLRLAWKHREENRANIDIFLAHGFAVEERCDSELSISVPATPLPRKHLDSIQRQEKRILNWNTDEREKPSEKRDSPGELRNYSLEDQGKEIKRKIDNDESVGSRTTQSDSTAKQSEEDKVADVKEEEEEEEERIISTNIEEKRKTRISIDCTGLHSPNSSTTSFPSLKEESAVASAKMTSDDFSSVKQKRASFHSGSNRAFLVPMIEKPIKGTTEVGKCPMTDRVVPVKSFEIRCASASTDKTATQKQPLTATETRSSPITSDKSVGLAKSSPTISSSEKTRRTNSAPPQRRGGGGGNVSSAARVQVSIVIDAPSLAEVASDKPIACGPLGGKNTVEKSEEASTKMSRERSVRSAPLKRRSKSAKRRFLAGVGGKDEEDARIQDRCGGRVRAYTDSRTTDVITMVSLVSSADSDSDVENSPGDDKLINELRNKLSTTPIIKTSINPNPGVTRKPIKSVSFQRYSFDEDPPKEALSQTSARLGEEKSIVGINPPRLSFVVNGHADDTLPWRQQPNITEVIAPPLAIPALLTQGDEETVPETAPLTDREKRCLAVPIGDLHDDKKRKLLRTRSISSRPIIPEQTNINASTEAKEQRPSHFVTGLVSPIDSQLPKVEQYVKEILPTKEMPPREMTSTEPHFQTTKEKECWHLYRRMCDKGVCVSFDTVLRGMLTPTEYRLRQKELSQDLL